LFFVTFGMSMPLAACGVFLPVIAETFGRSRGAIATALSLDLVIGGVAGFFVGRLADRGTTSSSKRDCSSRWATWSACPVLDPTWPGSS
jgi:MFS family permease